MLDIRGWTFGGVEQVIVVGDELGRHGMILKDDVATDSRKVSGYLLDLWDTI